MSADKKLIRIGSELCSRLLDSASIADADLPNRVVSWQQNGLDGMVFSIASNRSMFPGSIRNMTGLWWNVKNLEKRNYNEFLPDIQAFQSVSDWGWLTDKLLWSSMSTWDTPSLTKSQDWFNDAHWDVITNNVSIQARIAKEVGFKGVLLDMEQYHHHGSGGPWYHPFNYPEYQNGGYLLAGEASPPSFNDVAAKVFDRGKLYAQTLSSEFSGLTLIAIPEWHRPNGLLGEELLIPAFMDGLFAGLDANAKLIDDTETTYGMTSFNELKYVHDQVINQTLARSGNPQLVQAKFSVAIGIQTDGHNGGAFSDTDVTQNHRTPAQHQLAVTNALALSEEYAWLYGETSRFLTTNPTPLMQQYFQANIAAHPSGGPGPGPGPATAQGGSFSDGGIFTETFTNREPFHNVLDNPTLVNVFIATPPYPIQSRVAGGNDGPDISIANERVEWTDGFYPGGAPGNGEYFAEGFLDGTLGANDSYAVEATWVVNSLFGMDIGHVTGMVFRSNLLRPFGQFNQEIHTDIRLMAVPTGNDPNANTWDIRVHDATSDQSLTMTTDGGTNQGLGLAYGQAYQIMMHHLGNAAGDIDLYVDGALVGTFKDRAPTWDTEVFQLGNGTPEAGFVAATWMDNFKVGRFLERRIFIPEPASMLLLIGLGGWMALRRRA